MSLIKFLLRVFALYFLYVSVALSNSWPVPFAKTSPYLEGKKIALVLGAGPAGLIAARSILHAGTHDFILILEHRPRFSRFNMVNIFPESWPMLRKLGVDKDFSRIAQPSDFFAFHFDLGNGVPDEFVISDENTPETFDYRGPVAEIFKQPRVGLRILNLAQLQYQLSTRLAREPKVHFVHGMAVAHQEVDSQGMHSVRITTPQDSYLLTPDLIVIAEGAHSANRKTLNLKLKPVLHQQLWCSGSLDLHNYFPGQRDFIQVLEKLRPPHPSVRTFGIFQATTSEVFLNGEASDNQETVEHCLLRNAHALLDLFAMKDQGLTKSKRLPVSLKTQQFSPKLIAITPSKALGFSSGNNVILFGDAAGFATPRGGIGLSMVTTVYPQALLDLLGQWENSARRSALSRYDARVKEIVEYWHDRVATDDQVL